MKFYIYLLLLVNFILAQEKDFEVSSIIELTDDNYENLVTDKSEWIVAFTANWCGACKSLKPEYEKLAVKLASEKSKVKVAKIDVDSNPALTNRFMLFRLPTIYHIKNKQARDMGEINRDFPTLSNFVKDQAWKKIDVSNGFFSPYSFFAYLTFYLIGYGSKLIKSLPQWGFGVFLIVGLVIGFYWIQHKDTQTIVKNDQRAKVKKRE